MVILTPVAFCNYLLSVLDVAILSMRELEVQEMTILSGCWRPRSYIQPHHSLSVTVLILIKFLLIPYIAQRPVCTFLVLGQRLQPCSIKVTTFTLLSMNKFLLSSNFSQDTSRFVSLSQVVICFKYFAYSASNLNSCANLKRHNNYTTIYIANTRQGDKETALTKCVLDV